MLTKGKHRALRRAQGAQDADRRHRSRRRHRAASPRRQRRHGARWKCRSSATSCSRRTSASTAAPSTRSVRSRSTSNVLPRTHGSAIFTRGETQALVTVTLGTPQEAQKIEDFEGETFQRFMLHYNFPPFSVGEVKFMRGPARREIGHGNLARRALAPMLPPRGRVRVHDPHRQRHPRVERLVVDGLGLRRLAGADAGRRSDARPPSPAWPWDSSPASTPAKCAILSDIAGMEDHEGDMDFKVAGTRKGITALQMDIKVAGLPREIMARRWRRRRKAGSTSSTRWMRRSPRRAPSSPSSRRASTRSRFRRTASATSSAPAARPSAGSSKRPARRSTSTTTAR